MRNLTLVIVPLLLSLLGGCSLLPGGRLLAPESFGLVPVTPALYVETGADAATRDKLRAAMETAESAIRAGYGSVQSQPIVHACVTEQCLDRFGGKGTFAKVYGNRILLSPRGSNWHFIAHEWSHAEMLSRLSLTAWLRLPQWFDDGIAVALSEAPEHSEQHWQFLVAADIARPTSAEVRALKSLDQWLDAVSRYSDNRNAERRARGETEIHSVYAAAGHELRPWLASAGSPGLRRFIERMNAGEEFESAYQAGLSKQSVVACQVPQVCVP